MAQAGLTTGAVSKDVPGPTTPVNSPFPLDIPSGSPSSEPSTPVSFEANKTPSLNFGGLIADPELAHVELTKAIDDFAKLLSVVEVGLAGMLAGGAGDVGVIEEREEMGSGVSAL